MVSACYLNLRKNYYYYSVLKLTDCLLGPFIFHSFRESEVILRKTGSFVQVGSGKFYFLFSIMVYPDVEFGQLTDGHLTAFLHHSGVCRTCRERLKEMIDTEV